MTKQKLLCKECGYTEPIPTHCEKPMHVEEINEENRFVCWMGESCGVSEIPKHHNKIMEITISTEINQDFGQNRRNDQKFYKARRLFQRRST